MSGPGPCPTCPHGKGFNCPHCWPPFPTPPLGMAEVSKETFHGTVGRLDVHPTPQRHYTEWKARDGRVLGWSTPGYLHPRDEPHYFALPSLLEKTK